MDTGNTKPINVDDLLLTKMLEPLDSDQLAILEKIEKYDVSQFSEADVRAYIIDPITRILGYDKGTIFSADLGHTLKFLGTNRFPDYKFKLWNANFWLIEAKRPLFGQQAFEYEHLAQAIEYSVHPDVNAALVVLCDGLKIEIFDREVSVDTPVLRVRREELRRDFDKLRLLLEPIQVWFFQKRRIVRMLDKVFDREFNMGRVEEFSDLLERRLRSKRNQIVENFRQTVRPDSDEQRELALNAPIEEITELYFFGDFPIPIDNAVNKRLVELSETGTVAVVCADKKQSAVLLRYVRGMLSNVSFLAARPACFQFQDLNKGCGRCRGDRSEHHRPAFADYGVPPWLAFRLAQRRGADLS